ncbi:MAG: nitrile hydratase accessory protein, partial [Candidatus Binataceae bacterium]
MAQSLEAMMRARGIEPRGVTFAEPWEARAFALALDLAARESLEWEEFRQRLIAQIARADAEAAAGRDAAGYYECWLVALEAAIRAKGHASLAEIDRRAESIAAN